MDSKVFILVLNWNGKAYTLSCLDTLEDLEYGNCETIVIDNGSTDGSEEAIRTLYPAVKVIQNGRNLGYSEGNNRGIQFALEHGADYIFLINNDTRIQKNCVTELVKRAEENPNFGILGPVAFDYETGKEPLDSGFQIDLEVSEHGSIFKSINGERILNQANAVVEVDFVQGDAFFIKRAVFEKVGTFDSRFFLLHEEADLCVRAKNAGFSVGVVKNAAFQRMASPTIGVNTPLRSYYSTRNTFLFVSKHSPASKRERNIKQTVRRIKWNIQGYYLPSFCKTGCLNYLKCVVSILRGCADFFLGRFGRM